ncbi:monovalent cation/H+ antiporter complex subunit F [Geodermatophilus sp. YIM 151500]|uniref:monovalent cation/H+ antiporter complex subunit F n=1 Tax=Geodermatophilus sp. YIM 151500 TaxID=2984531 RepID=UPI0021E3E72A|nr:monovalent cation/H+ antiporter complex subunit F [Geodermatophilus sp. YIM 151500]MCV2491057.1 monovalent cation/H+ antiporter complex subunit F [Geodermatophilus sp. YIM 151500]
MTAVSVVAYVLLTAAVLLALVRLVRGPSLLDRVVAADTILAVVAAALVVVAALERNTVIVPVVVVVSLLGFLGAVGVARYVGGMLIRSTTGDGVDVGLPEPAEERGVPR